MVKLNYSKSRSTRANIRLRALEELWERGDHLERILDTNQMEMYKQFHDFDRAKYSRFVFLCSRRLGKTVLSFALCDEICRKEPGVRVLFLSKTDDNLKEIIDQASTVFFSSCPPSLKPQYRIKDKKFVYSNGSEIRLKGMDKAGPDSVRGVKAKFVVLDEFCFMDNLTTLIKSSVGPMINDEKGRILMISSSPDTPGHDSINFITEAERFGALIKKTIYDCPRWSESDREEFARDAGGYDSDTFRREYLCVHPDELVITSSGAKPIKDIQIGELVKTHTGKFKKVKAVKSKENTEQLVSIKNTNNCGLKLTNSHRLLISEGLGKDFNTHTIDWVAAKDLIIPKKWDGFPTRIYTLTPAVLKEEKTSITEDMAYIAGWYTAEGFCATKSQQVHFCMNPSDDVEGLEEAIENTWGKSLKCYLDHKSVATYTLNSKKAKTFLSLFGTGSKNKKVFQEIINGPKEIKIAFLKGYFKGDGTYNLKRKTAGAISISKPLLVEISDMLLQLGVVCTLKNAAKGGPSVILGRDVNTNPSYQLSLAGQGFVDFMRLIHNIELPNNPKKGQNFIRDGYLYSLVKKIEPIDYKGKVYDLQVEDDESFCLPLTAVHNCEIITERNRAILPACTEQHMEKVVVPYEKPDWYDPDHYISIDPGGRDQTAILYAYYDYPEATLVIEDETILNTPDTETITKTIKKKLETDWNGIKPHKIIMDNNNLILVKDMQKLHGMSVRATKKDKKEAQVNNTNIMMQNLQISINPRCVNLIQQCRYGIWNKTRTSYERTEALSHCDAVDALVYLVRNISRSKNPVQETQPDWSVNVFHGTKEEAKSGNNVFKKLFGRR